MEYLCQEIDKQFTKILSSSNNYALKIKYEKELKKIFKKIFVINYLSNRVEVSDKFKDDYYKICISCLIEAFQLNINNYIRGTLLVLRSALENNIKHIINVYNLSIDERQFLINDRSYSANKKMLDTIINEFEKNSINIEGNKINSRMESEYKKLSGIMHSLVEESKENVLEYFKDLDDVKIRIVESVLSHFNNITDDIISFNFILCKKSFLNWNSDELIKMFNIIYGKKRSKSYLNMFKNNII